MFKTTEDNYIYDNILNSESIYRLSYLDINGNIHQVKILSIIRNIDVLLNTNVVKDVLILNEKVDYIIYDLNGKTILKGYGDSIDFTELNSSVYILNVKNTNIKIIKQ
jgi:alkyl hydroperoxide reductase subunit AhpF